MAINVANEPNQQLFGFLQMLAGFGEAKRRYELLENQQKGASQQATANAVGGAVGDIGKGHFDGKTRQWERAEQDRRIQEQNAFRLKLEQQDQDLRSFGLPTDQIESLAQQQGMDSAMFRDQLRTQRAQQQFDMIDAQKRSDKEYEYKYSPANDRKIRQLNQDLDWLVENQDNFTEEEFDQFSTKILDQMSGIKKHKVPRTTPVPETWDEMVQAQRIVEQEVPGGLLIKSFDRSGAPRTEYIKYEQAEQDGGFTTKDYMTLRKEAIESLKTVGDDGIERPPTQQEIKEYVDAAMFDKHMSYERQKAGFPNQNPMGHGGQPVPQTQFGPGAMGGQPPPQASPEEGFLGTDDLALSKIEELASVHGPDPKKWPPEAKKQARPAAQLMELELKQKYPNGFPENATPEEATEVLRQIDLIKGILGG